MYPDVRQGTKTIAFKNQEEFLSFVDSQENDPLIYDIGYADMVLLVAADFPTPDNAEEEIH